MSTPISACSLRIADAVERYTLNRNNGVNTCWGANLASSIQKTFRCIETIANSPAGLTVSEVAGAAALSRPAATRLLDGLAADGVIVRDETSRRYHLSLRLHEWSTVALQARTPINVARKELVKLTMEIRRESNFLVMEGQEIILLERFEDVDGVVISRPVAGRRPGYLTATGKAIVAFSPQMRAFVERARSNGANPETAEDILAELSAVRENGYALSHNARREQAAVGVPIFGRSGEAIAAIGSYLQAGLEDADSQALISQMLATADRISHYLGHRSPAATFT